MADIDMKYQITTNDETLESAIWIMDYVIQEGFSPEHMRALKEVVSMMNYSNKSEKAILDFARSLYKFRALHSSITTETSA